MSVSITHCTPLNEGYVVTVPMREFLTEGCTEGFFAQSKCMISS